MEKVMVNPTISDLYRYVSDFGSTVSTRRGVTKEVVWTCVLWDPKVAPVRDGMSKSLSLVEASLVLLGEWDESAVRRHCPTVPVEMFEPYARYGPLVGRQIDRVVRILRRDPSARYAVVSLSRPSGVSGNQPCNCLVQYLVRDGRLTTLLYVRSWDLYRGLPYDAQLWTVVGCAVSREVGASPGPLVATVGSLHVYDADRPSGVGLARLSCDVSGLSDARVRAREYLYGSGTPWVEWEVVQ